MRRPKHMPEADWEGKKGKVEKARSAWRAWLAEAKEDYHKMVAARAKPIHEANHQTITEAVEVITNEVSQEICLLSGGVAALR